MSFGKKSSTPSTPQPTFTQQAQTTQPITRTANSAEAQDRVASTADPQSALLSSGQTSATAEDDELKRRQYNDSGMF